MSEALPAVVDLRIEATGVPPEDLSLVAAHPIVVGRDASCHVVLRSPDVSRRHLELSVEAGNLYLRDLSSNGTWVSGREAPVLAERVELADDVAFQAGPYRMRARVRGLPRSDAPDGHARPSWDPKAPTAAASSDPLTVGAIEPQAVLRYARPGARNVDGRLRRRIQSSLVDHLDLAKLDRASMSVRSMRPKVREGLTRIVRQLEPELPPGTDVVDLIDDMTDEALGLGPLEPLLNDDAVTEIMVVDAQNIFVEHRGLLQLTDLRFTDDESVTAVLERIVSPLGRRIDQSTPLVDARLKDGSRVNAIIPPLAIRGPCITVRKFPKKRLALEDLIGFGSLTPKMARFLTNAVITRKNIVVSGGTGSGKTTLLNVLSGSIPAGERIVTIEDAAELRLNQPHVVTLESRPPNMEGKGAITIRDLVRNALRMRPDRILVGECRGGEAIDMLQAMNTGHDGSMTTTHANSAAEAIARLETLVLMAGLDLPIRAIREQIAGSIDLVVQTSRHADGRRRIDAIVEVVGMDDDGRVEHRPIYEFVAHGIDDERAASQQFRATGYLPTFLEEFLTKGLLQHEDVL